MKDETVKKSANRVKKEELVAELAEKFGKANAVVFTNYQGLTHKQLEGFKKAIKPLQAEYVVAKNSLLKLAMDESKFKLDKDSTLEGQTGTLFLYDDVISPLKELAKIIKELNLPEVKFGIMEKDFITGEQVIKLSTLPTREVLLAQLVGSLKGPIFGLHRALNWNLQKLVMSLKAIADKKPAEAAKATSPEPEKATQPQTEPVQSPTTSGAANDTQTATVDTPEPEKISDETAAEVAAEVPEDNNPTIEAENNEAKSPDEGKDKGGEN